MTSQLVLVKINTPLNFVNHRRANNKNRIHKKKKRKIKRKRERERE